MSIVTDIASVQATSAIAAAIMIAGSAIAASFGISITASKFLESYARQPELGASLFIRTLIMIGLIDIIPMVGVAAAFLTILTSPFANLVLNELPNLIS